MSEENEIKDRIFLIAEEMFLKYGFSKVTMDEIASGLGMSKKTLYKFFTGKENLVRELIKERRCETENHINEIWADKDEDFVVKLKKMMNYIGKQSTKLHGPLSEDLRKSMPEIWEEVSDLKRNKGLEKAVELFKKGVENNVFRSDIVQEIVILMYTSSIQSIMNPETLSQLPISANQAIEAIFKVLFEGILTDEGRMKYISYPAEENNIKENSTNENN